MDLSNTYVQLGIIFIIVVIVATFIIYSKKSNVATTTSVPTTRVPITLSPTTSVPITSMPTTSMSTTPMPTTSMSTTPMPATPMPATPMPATPMPATPMPATPMPATPMPATPTPTISIELPSSNVVVCNNNTMCGINCDTTCQSLQYCYNNNCVDRPTMPPQNVPDSPCMSFPDIPSDISNYQGFLYKKYTHKNRYITFYPNGIFKYQYYSNISCGNYVLNNTNVGTLVFTGGVIGNTSSGIGPILINFKYDSSNDTIFMGTGGISNGIYTRSS